MVPVGFHLSSCRCAAIFLVWAVVALAAERQTGTVIGIVDGDTIDVLVAKTPVRVRLYGIDAPERRQAFGTRARQALSDLAFGKTVVLVTRTRDRHGRLVADVILPDRQNLSHELVRAGFAWWFRRYAARDEMLRVLEEEAREAGRGLWADMDAVAPWVWRRHPKE